MEILFGQELIMEDLKKINWAFYTGLFMRCTGNVWNIYVTWDSIMSGRIFNGDLFGYTVSAAGFIEDLNYLGTRNCPKLI